MNLPNPPRSARIPSSVLLALSLVLGAVSGPGAVRYVSPEGDDANDGLAPESPRRTIKSALASLTKGDTLYVMDGVFDVSTQGPTNMFAFQFPADSVVMLAAPGEAPTIDWTGLVPGSDDRFLNGSNAVEGCVLSGLRFTNWSGDASFIHNTAMDSLRIENCTFEAVSPLGGSSIVRYEGVDGASVSSCSFVGRVSGSFSYAILLHGTNLAVEGCTFNSEADLADTLGWSAGIVAVGVDGLVIRDCLGFNAGNDRNMDEIASHFVALFDADDVLIEDLTFKRYLFDKDQGSFVHNANGIEVASWLGDPSENVEIRSCELWGAGHGIKVGNAAADVQISHVWCDSTYDDCIFFDDMSVRSSASYVVSHYSQDNGLDFQGSQIRVEHCTLVRPKNFALKLATPCDDVTIRDVIVYDVRDPVFRQSAVVRIDNGAGTWDFDHNVYFDPDGAQTAFSVGPASLSFAEWQSAGHDGNGLWADPLLCDPDGRAWPMLDAAFRLHVGSPAAGAASDGRYVGALGADCALVFVDPAPVRPPRASLVPNPTRGRQVVVLGETVGRAIVSVFDVSGRLVGVRVSRAGGRSVMLDPAVFGGAAPGVYFVRVETDAWSERLRTILLD